MVSLRNKTKGLKLRKDRDDVYDTVNMGEIENKGSGYDLENIGDESDSEEHEKKPRSETEDNVEMFVSDFRDHDKHENQTFKHKKGNEIDDASDLDSDIEELIAPCIEDNESNNDKGDTEYAGPNEPYLKHIDPLLQIKTCTYKCVNQETKTREAIAEAFAAVKGQGKFVPPKKILLKP